MSDTYFAEIVIRLVLVQTLIVVACLLVPPTATESLLVLAEEETVVRHEDEIIKTIIRRDGNGVEQTEYAFSAPSKGLPNHVLELYCSSIKLRLYWGGYREEVKQTHRKGLYLRRMARFAKHVFQEVRDVDRPFNATMLSRVDRWLMAKFDVSAPNGQADDEFDEQDDEDAKELQNNSYKQATFKGIKAKLSRMIHTKSDSNNEILEEIDASDTIKELDKQGQQPAIERIKKFAKGWNFKKTALLIYTRWRTMWWMTLSCLYAKYYLWDPALDEFTKLKRSLLMWPELQMVKLQDLQCKPVMFFRRIMDICKILNPLMRVDFGQFNYNSMSRFKSDS